MAAATSATTRNLPTTPGEQEKSHEVFSIRPLFVNATGVLHARNGCCGAMPSNSLRNFSQQDTLPPQTAHEDNRRQPARNRLLGLQDLAAVCSLARKEAIRPHWVCGLCGRIVVTMAKLQHYVAQSYLRHFACERGKHPKIWCYDKANRKAFKTNIRNVAGENYFYDDATEASQPFEALLGQAEANFANARRCLVELSDAQDMSESDRVVISIFVALQLVRTPEHRIHAEQLMVRTRDFLAEERGVGPALKEWLTENPALYARQQHLYNISSDLVPQLAGTIALMRWIVLTNDTPMPFWTSDNPVCLFNPVDAGPDRGNLGLRRTGIQAFLPLSSTMTLAACDPHYYATMPARNAVAPEHVRFQNSLQVSAATQYIFSASSDFAIVEEVLSGWPKLADPKRQRVFVGGGPIRTRT
ncbi:MAG: DUF4238 domain-containing protein [Gammaproteobacteria bacterium]